MTVWDVGCEIDKDRTKDYNGSRLVGRDNRVGDADGDELIDCVARKRQTGFLIKSGMTDLGSKLNDRTL